VNVWLHIKRSSTTKVLHRSCSFRCNF